MPKKYKAAYNAERKLGIGNLKKSKVVSKSVKHNAARKGMT